MSIVYTYRVLVGRDSQCDNCDRPAKVESSSHGSLESSSHGSLDWLRCPTCARHELRFSTGVSAAMLALRAAELDYAANVAETLFGPSRAVTPPPWPDAGAPQEPLGALPEGFEDVERDGYDLQWVPAHRMNFGMCDRCFGSAAVLVGVNELSSVEETICRACAVLTMEEAASLRLAIVEAEAPARVDVVRTEIDAAREEMGFVPVVVPPLTDAARRREIRLAHDEDDEVEEMLRARGNLPQRRAPDNEPEEDTPRRSRAELLRARGNLPQRQAPVEDDDEDGDEGEGGDAPAARSDQEPRLAPSDNRGKSTASGVQSKFFHGRRTRCGASKRNRYRG